MASFSELVEMLLGQIGVGRFQHRALLLCAAGYFAICSELLLVVFLASPLTTRYRLSANDYALLPVLVSLSSFLSSLGCGKLADRYGRNPIFTWSLVLAGAAGFLCAFSRSFWSMIVMRSVVGVGLGGLAAVDYVVFQELAPRAARGRYLYVVFAAGCVGVLYLAAIAAFFDPEWQWLVILAALPTIVVGVLRWLHAVETPHYLVKSGQLAEAYTVLKGIACMNGAEGVLPSQEEFLQLLSSQPVYPSSQASITSVMRFMPRHLTLPLVVVWLLQSTAYWGLTLFLPKYFEGVGVAANRTIFAMVACELPGCLFSAMLIELPLVGRLGMLRINYVVAAGAAVSLGLGAGHSGALVACLACLVYFALIPNWGVLFIFTPESYPTELRATAMGFYQALQGLPSLFSPFLSARLSKESSSSYMLCWAVCLLSALVASMALRPSAAAPSRHSYGLPCDTVVGSRTASTASS